MPVLANDGGTGKMNGKYTEKKVLNESYSVNKTALLAVQNSFGSLTLSSWNRNEIKIEVTITTNGNNEKKVRERLDEITVDFTGSRDKVSAKTNFGQKNNSWNWGNSNNKVNVQVDYVIKLPVKSSIDLANDYGKIILDRVDGHAKISCDYGSIEAGELRGRENMINFDYSSNCQFGYVNSAKINADYSSFNVNRSEELWLNSDYTKGTIDQVGTLTYGNDYGSLSVNKVRNLTGNGDYISVKLDEVSGDVDITADYGAIKINRLTGDAGNVNIRSKYTGIKLGYDPAYHFDFEIKTEYASVSGKEDFEVQISTEKSNERYYKGYRGQANSGNLISIISDYGGISFMKK